MALTLTMSMLEMDAVRFSETLVSTYKFIWRYNPQDQHRHSKKIILFDITCFNDKYGLRFERRLFAIVRGICQYSRKRLAEC